MQVTLWGTRGSLPNPGPETTRYGGNTSCVQVRGADDTYLILDAGTGIRSLGKALPRSLRQVHVLLTHLHMDHLQGLGFFAPLFNPEAEVHIWGPASTMLSLETRLIRYLSPPLFPIGPRDFPCKLVLHEVPSSDFELGEFRISSEFVCHPGPTVGYRIAASDTVLTYIPDHEPALGLNTFPLNSEWTSGFNLATGADLLIHDAQYSSDEYRQHIGWGHSSIGQAIVFAGLAEVKQLVLFHHDPEHNDDWLDQLVDEAFTATQPVFDVIPGAEGAKFMLGSASSTKD